MKRSRRHPYLYWALLLLALAVVAWCWWQAAKGTGTPERSTPALSSTPSRAAVPAPQLSRSPGTNPAAPLKKLPAPALTQAGQRSTAGHTSPPLPSKSLLTNASPPALVEPAAAPPITNSQPSLPTNRAPTLSPLPSPASSPDGYPRAVQDLLEAQVALARQGISPGSLDGLMGSQTRAALRAFQRREHLPRTGELDSATRERLLLATSPLTCYTVTSDDLARIQPLSATWLGKSQQSALDYETLLELVAEKSQAHPNLLRRLNPALKWAALEPGSTVQVPELACESGRTKGAFLVISLAGKTLQAFDAQTNLLVHFPCSIAQRVEKRPVGELHISVVAPHPNYTFDPEIFPESAEARQIKNKLILAPGPNNPVGVAWIGLDKPGYGIHGTPSPEQVGRTESHGCFRLANWNAARLVSLVWVGMPVYVQP